MRLSLFFILCAFPVLAHAQDFTPASESYVRATVLSVSQTDAEPGIQEVTVHILSGDDEGKEVSFENTIINARDDMHLFEGETVVMQRLEKADGTVTFYLREKYRLHSIILLTVIFFALGIILGGRIGFTSLIGLAVSITILMGFIVPRIIAGDPPLLISVIGATLIASSSLYIAHGFNRRITIALISTICTLILSVFVAVVFVWIAKLYGLGTEESVFLQFGLTQSINLKGVLLGGMIIGALGVLDDITTALRRVERYWTDQIRYIY